MEPETLKTYIKTHLKIEFIYLSKFPTSGPIFFEKKFNSGFYLYVDYWGFNNLTIENHYPLPLIGKFLYYLGRANRFTQLNLTSTYYQIRIRESDNWKIAFCTRYDHFKYQIMSFDLSNALASIQRYINKLPAKKMDIFVIVYQEDILVYTKDLG